MKRRQLVFVTAVLSAALTGFVLERQRKGDSLATVSLTGGAPVELPPLVLPDAREVLVGRVVDADGGGVADVGVHLYRAERERAGAVAATEPLPWTRTGPDGRFRLEGAPSGRFAVALLAPLRERVGFEVTLPHDGPVEWTLGAPLEPPTPLPEITLGTLVGRIAPPVGALPEPYPVAGYEVWFEPVGDEEAWLAGAVPRRVTVDATGAFEVPDLAAARYAVRVLPPWATGGSWPVLEELSYHHRVPGPDGAAPPPLALRLRSGTLGGRAYDDEGAPLEGALVRVWPSDRPNEPWPTVATDAEGQFLVRDLPPGAYRVQLRAGGAEHSEEVTVRIGARTTVTPPRLTPSGGG